MSKKKIIWSVVFGLAAIFILRGCINSYIDGNQKAAEKAAKELSLKFIPKLTSKELKSESVLISGPIGEYLKFEGEAFNLEYQGTQDPFARDIVQTWNMKVLLKRTNKKLEWDLETVNGNYTGIELTVLDKNGTPVSNSPKIECSGHKLEDLLGLKSGETAWIEFTTSSGDPMEEDVISTWSSFTAMSEIGFVKEDTDDVIDTNVEANNETNSDEWDKMLDEYEGYVNSYIKLFKKSQEGDLSAMTEYLVVMTKAQSTFEKMDKVRGDMSSKHVGRMMRIQTKMLSAL